MEKLIHRRATAADSVTLCDLMRETPMGQSIRTVQDRGENFFAASRLQANDLEVWAAFEIDSGRAAAIFSAGSRKVFLEGEIKAVRYLSDLRIRSEYRSGLLLARGFKLLKREVFGEDEWAQTLVLKDNSDAADLLTSGRGGLPNYHPSGTYQSWFLRDQKIGSVDPSIQVRRASESDFGNMQELQNQVGPSASYTPVLDFAAMPEVDFLLAYKHERLVGMIGLWDVSAYKSTIVTNYSRPFRLARPVYNLWAAIHNLPKLPPPGGRLNARAVTAVLCQNRDPAILRSLLAQALEQPGLFAIGLDTTDPLSAALAGLKSHATTAGHYLVGFSGQPPQSPRPFYFDFARL